MNEEADERFISKFPLGELIRMYAFGWLIAFTVTIVSALISNGIFGVPLHEVANTNLSIMLFVVILFLCLYIFLIAANIIVGEFVVAFGVVIFACVYSFMPFSTVLGYTVYGYLGRHPLNGTSYVFSDFVRIYLGVFTEASKIISVIVVSTGLVHTGTLARHLPPTNEMPQWISAFVALASLMTTLFRGRAGA